MEWVLIVTLMLGDKLHTVEMAPIGGFLCESIADYIKGKRISIDGQPVVVVDVTCVQK